VKDAIEARLAELNAELEKGQARLRELEIETAQVQEVVLRILGAKQVLEEVLAVNTETDGQPDNPVEESIGATKARRTGE
jgi:predicted nuclease with TOPRIM domain